MTKTLFGRWIPILSSSRSLTKSAPGSTAGCDEPGGELFDCCDNTSSNGATAFANREPHSGLNADRPVQLEPGIDLSTRGSTFVADVKRAGHISGTEEVACDRVGAGSPRLPWILSGRGKVLPRHCASLGHIISLHGPVCFRLPTPSSRETRPQDS